MIWVIAALLGAIAVFIWSGFITSYKEVTDANGNTRMRSQRTWKVNGKSMLALLPLLLVAGGCIASIPAGHTGVLVTFGKVESTVLGEGINFKLPYQQVVRVDNRVQRQAFVMEAFSSDIQQTNVVGSINFTVNKGESQNLYRNVGVNYYETVIYPRVLEDVKLVFSKYSAEGLIEKRTALSDAVEELVQADISQYGIEIVSISIENIDFTDAFTDAVEAKQVAQQRKLTTQTEQESAIIIADADAERLIIAAKADAEQAKIRADADAYTVKIAAEAESQANKAVAESLTQALLEYTKILQWNGTVPQVQAGQDSLYPIITVPSPTPVP